MQQGKLERERAVGKVASLNGYIVIYGFDYSAIFGLETCCRSDVGLMLHNTERLTENHKHERSLSCSSSTVED